MSGKERTFKIKSKSLLIKTVQAMPIKLYESYCELEANLINMFMHPKKEDVVKEFLQIKNLKREMWFEAEGDEIGVAKKAIIYLLRRGYSGHISFSAYFKYYEEYPDPIEYQYARFVIDGNTLTLSCDEKFPLDLKDAFKNILRLYPRKKVRAR